MKLFSLISLISIILTGCIAGSKKPNLYILESITDQHFSPEYNNQNDQLQITNIKIPNYLQRKSIVVKKSFSMLLVLPFMQWAEPLDQGIKRVISENFITYQGPNYLTFSNNTPMITINYDKLFIEIIAFNIVNYEYIDFYAKWEIINKNNFPVQTGISKHQIPIKNKNFYDAVMAMNLALNELTKDIMRARQDSNL